MLEKSGLNPNSRESKQKLLRQNYNVKSAKELRKGIIKNF
jgi:hypothetical protein